MHKRGAWAAAGPPACSAAFPTIGQRMQYAGLNQHETVAPPAAQTGLQAQAQTATLPAGFDVAGFLRGAKMNFIKLQAANDAGQAEPIREFTTDEMFDELKKDIAER